jgi:hypothetical protein
MYITDTVGVDFMSYMLTTPLYQFSLRFSLQSSRGLPHHKHHVFLPPSRAVVVFELLCLTLLR